MFHKSNKKESGEHHHSPLKHMLHMVLCCGLPVLIIFMLPFIAKLSPVLAGGLGLIAPFICPIMMGGMMFMMMPRKNKKSCCDGNVVEEKELQKPKRIEES